MKKNKKIIPIIIVICFLAIGFALLTKQLDISAITGLRGGGWYVVFESMERTKGSVGEKENYYPTMIGSNTWEFHVDLKKPGDFYEFKTDMVVHGTLDGMIESVKKTPVLTEEQKKVIVYTVKYAETGEELKRNDLIPLDEFKTIIVRVEYKKEIDEEDLDIIPSEGLSMDMTFSVKFTQATKEAVVVTSLKGSAKTLVEKANPRSVYNYTDGNTSEMYKFNHYATKQLPRNMDYRYIGETHCQYDNGAYWVPQREGGTCPNIYKKIEDSSTTYVTECEESTGITCEELIGTLKELKNYITYNNETWRIIGVIENKIKIIRNESIGQYAIDLKKSVGSADYRGSNDWTDAQLMYMLNQGNYGKSTYTRVGNLIYDDREPRNLIYEVGKVPAEVNQSTTSYDADPSPWSLNETAWNQAAVAKFYNGMKLTDYSDNADKYYTAERSKKTLTIMDDIPSVWEGKVGLMYVSDVAYTFWYGVYPACSNKFSGCLYPLPTKSWLLNSDGYGEFTLSTGYPFPNYIYISASSGTPQRYGPGTTNHIRPVVYLKPETVLEGTGSKSDPYRIVS